MDYRVLSEPSQEYLFNPAVAEVQLRLVLSNLEEQLEAIAEAKNITRRELDLEITV